MLRLARAVLFASLAIGTPLLTRQQEVDPTEPCALVSGLIEYSKLDANSTAPYRVDVDKALACLRSVPIDVPANALMLKTFKALISLQSNLAYLKDPPPGSLYPPVDILAAVDDIATKLNDGYFENEYDYQFALWEIAQSSKDFHFVYTPDIVTVFSWERDHSLLSVSSDGTSLPEIYLSNDLSGSSEYQRSPVTHIDGIDVQTWVNDYAGQQTYGHDPDSNFNHVLWNAALSGTNSPGSFAQTTRPQSLRNEVTFANGTTSWIYAYASTSKEWDGVIDGPSFFQKFCTGEPASPDPSVPTETDTTVPTETSATSPDLETETTVALNPFVAIPTQTSVPKASLLFPDPLVLLQDYSLAGYLPEDLQDTAVLQIPSFEPKTGPAQDFQNAVRGLLATAQAQGRTKLVIDLRGNGGGLVALGYDTFRQIFPTIMPYDGTNVRSTPLLRYVLQSIYKYVQSTQIEQWNPLVTAISGTSFNTIDYFNGSYMPFESAQAFYGPYNNYNDDFTAIQRVDLSKARQTTPIDIYGFNNNTLPVPPVFKPNNIVLLQDGMCGSTCAIFSEFMKSQGNVKTIVVGGRKQAGPMQAVGGSKGAEVINLAGLARAFDAANLADDYTQAGAMNSSYLTDFSAGLLQLYSRTTEGKGLSINYRNNIRESDISVTPLQHVYEAADCRFFYTESMLSNQVKVWERARDIHWGNASCVPGSAGHPSSLSGALLSYVDADPPTGANYTFGSTNQTFPSGVANPASTRTRSIKPTAAALTEGTAMSKATTYLGHTTSLVVSPTLSASTTSTQSLTSSSRSSSSSSRASQTSSSGAPGRYTGSFTAGVFAAAVAAMYLLV